jgi:carboxypeptidase Q
MKYFFCVLTLLFIFSSNNVSAQQDAQIKKLVEIGKTDNLTMQHQDILCNRIGGRPIGSDNYTNAALWALNEFTKWGLNAELDESGEMPLGFDRGPWFGKMIKPKEMHLYFGTPSFTAGTKGVQRGPVVIMPSTSAGYDSIKEKFKGAWVLIDGVNDGWPRDKDSIRTNTKKLLAAGALGTIQISHLPFRLLDDRNAKSWDDLPVLCDIKLLDKQFEEIKSLVSKGEEVVLEFDIRNYFKQGPIVYHNVIATIPGTEFPDEYVVLGAHLDSYDSATGAIDDGSGVAPMMEVARMFMKAGIKPKRSIMIHFYAGEERGLLGSNSWVQKNPDKLSRISVMLNKDFGTNPIVGMSIPPSLLQEVKPVQEIIDSAKLKYPFKLTEGSPFRKAGRGRTDSFSFMMADVPTPNLRSQGPQVYDKTWHTLFDTYDEVIADAQEDAAIKIALMTYYFANTDKMLTREGAFLPDGVYADMNTNRGRITLSLDYEHVPMTSANFVGLAEGTIKNDAVAGSKPYFNGSIWHRVVPGHVIQAGMPAAGKETEGPGYEFPNEIYKELSHSKAGMLGMANSGPNTNGSQFYITLGDRSYLDGNYTLFGWVTEGMDVVNKIIQGDTIKSVVITRIGEKANQFKPTTESFAKMNEEAKQKVKESEEKRLKTETRLIQNDYPNTQTTSSGIKYIISKEGSGEKAKPGSVITAKYSGKFLINGTLFFSTAAEGKPNNIDAAETFEYKVGESKINPALDEMLGDMKLGEKRTVIALSNFAYDSSGFYGKTIEGKKRFVISPNTSLVYEIEILEVK